MFACVLSTAPVPAMHSKLVVLNFFLPGAVTSVLLSNENEPLGTA